MQILIVEEKHGTWYYAADTKEHLYSAALKIVSERYQTGWWYVHPDELYKPDTREPIEVPENATKEIKTQIDLHNRSIEAHKRSHKIALIEWGWLEKALEEKDGKCAWEFLKSRHGGEYEGCYLESVIVVEPADVSS